MNERMKLYRKLTALGLAAAMAVGMAVTVSAASPVTVTVNGAQTDAGAYINDDWRTMVSTDIAGDLGLTATVSGDSVTFTDGETTQTYTVGAAVEDTAVEQVVNLASPRRRTRARVAKDVAAGAVLLYDMDSRL